MLRRVSLPLVITGLLLVIVLGVELGAGCGASAEPDQRRIAYHEAGHALVAMLTPGGGAVYGVSIMPRGRWGGATYIAPEHQLSSNENHLRSHIEVFLAGYAAEEVAFGQARANRGTDMRWARRVGESLVARAVMSSGGVSRAALPRPLPLLPLDEGDRLARIPEIVDWEVPRILEQGQARARRVLANNRRRLDALAEALLKRKTLEGPAAYAAAGIAPVSRGPRVSSFPD